MMKRLPFVRGDIDGFFGLFIDNLVQLMFIAVACPVFCGIPSEVVVSTILPGAAVSILVGNVFYAWQARRLMKREGRDDVTALPYGINTPSVIAYIFFVMGPVYNAAAGQNPTPEQQQAAGRLAWQAGLFACFLSGVMECGGAFIGDWLRKHTPRAALLSALAGIAITFIAMQFIFQMFAEPAVGLLPMLIVVVAYAARVKLPLGMPAGLLAVLVGTGLGWMLFGIGWTAWKPGDTPYELAIHWPQASVGDVFAFFSHPGAWAYLSVIVPMGLFNIVGSLQNLESAEAAGDRFPTRSSLMVNGLGTLVAAFFGSAFPTTIYIGHPGWKALGSRSAYSTMNGIVVSVLVLLGGMTLVLNFVPMAAALGILLWIGIIITAQAFTAVPQRHAIAVAFGLIPPIAGLSFVVMKLAVVGIGQPLTATVEPMAQVDWPVEGMAALEKGMLLTSMLWSAMLAFAIDRRFLIAAWWTLAAAVLSAVGIIHAYELTAFDSLNRMMFDVGPEGGLIFRIAAPKFAVMYLIAAGLLVVLHYTQKESADDEGAKPLV